MEKINEKLLQRLQGHTIEDLKKLRTIVGGNYGGSGGATTTKGGTYTAKSGGGCFDDSTNDYGPEGTGGGTPAC